MITNEKMESKVRKKGQGDDSDIGINPMRVLYRAFKVAYDMMIQRKDSLKKDVEKAKEVEQQYMVMKRTADQLVQVIKSYQNDVRFFDLIKIHI